jgi:hypothetical protein
VARKKTLAASEGIAPALKEEKRGRPTLYTEAIAAEICQRIAEGETLNQICRSDHMPSRPTIVSWVLEDRSGFSDRYARARHMLLEHWSDEVVDISDDGSNDWMERNHGEDKQSSWTINGEHVQRSRLRVDTRKWLLSKLKPERYGDRVEHSGPQGGPIQHQVGVSWMTEDQAKARGWA